MTIRPVITLCGSTKFKSDFERVNRDLTMLGILVISLGVFGHADMPDANWDDGNLKVMLDNLHLRKIDLADAICVVDPGGYIGSSTKNEIAYAEQRGKPVYYMSHGDLGL